MVWCSDDKVYVDVPKFKTPTNPETLLVLHILDSQSVTMRKSAGEQALSDIPATCVRKKMAPFAKEPEIVMKAPGHHCTTW